MPADDPALVSKRLQRLAAILPSTRPGVTNDVEASKKHARALARELKLDKRAARDLVLAAELHEIGKATIDRDTLYAPGELDSDLKAAVDAHAENAAELVAPIERPDVASALALQNERYDGTGPAGVRGEDLPVLARALSVVSAYVAMTSKRPFRDALDRDHALEILGAEAGRQFDASIVEAFISTIPQKRLAVAAAGAGASIARPIRGMQLAYRRHGRVSTAVVSSFSAAAVLIGASTLAPGGIGSTFERVGWPTQTRQPAVVTEDAAIALAADEESTDSSEVVPVDETPVAGALGGIVESISFDLSGSTESEATTIEGGYSGQADGGDLASDEQTTSGGSEGTTDDGWDETTSEDPEEDSNESSTTAKKNEEDKGKAEPEPSESPTPTPSESPTAEPEPSESPTPEGTDGYEGSPSDDAPGQVKKDAPAEEEPAEEDPSETTPDETTPSDSTEDDGTSGDKDKDNKDRGRHDSDKFKAYQSEEQDDETEDLEPSDSETDDVETEEETTDEPVEDEAVVEEVPVATAPRDTTPTWGSLH
jgi:hypothetical protein